jgi:FemAB-related protein (PEP-CTERM system-associated)
VSDTHSGERVAEAGAADAARWGAYVQAAPGASVYHQWGWRAVLQESFGHRTWYLLASRGDAVQGVLPLALIDSRLFGRYLVSLPFVTGGGICAQDDATAMELAARAAEVARRERAASVELRHVAARLDVPTRQTKVRLTLPLPPDPEALWRGLDGKVRNQVRKGMKSGLKAELATSEAVGDFHRVHARNMRDLGSPAHGADFFQRVLATFPGGAHLFLVRQGARPVAGALLLTYRDRVEVPWAAALRESWPLCANNLLYWTLLDWACAAGYRTFDFGRCTAGSGPYRFKRQWGAQAEQLNWQYLLPEGQPLPALNPDNPRFRFAIECWKRLPLGLATWLGPRLLRGLPG